MITFLYVVLGIIVPYAVLPALLVATVMKMRSIRLTVSLLVLVIAAFCYGVVVGANAQKKEQGRARYQGQHAPTVSAPADGGTESRVDIEN